MEDRNMKKQTNMKQAVTQTNWQKDFVSAGVYGMYT